MRLVLRIFILCLLPAVLSAQRYATTPPPAAGRQSVAANSVLQQQAIPEADCSNGIDDNGNGLTDLEDFHCYFSPENFYGNCKPSKIVWGSSMMYGFFTLNLETGKSNYYPSPVYVGFSDLSWTSNGKLYASGDWGGIYSIDPFTFAATRVGEIEGHYYTNGMTGDNNGNLIVASFVTQYECNILRFNPATGKSELLFPLTKHGLTSAGDMCFLNGYLYVSCNGNKIARINLATKELKVIKTLNPPLRDDMPDIGSYAMFTLGDGYLYISDNRTGISRVDPASGQAQPFHSYSELDIFTTGFATYPDVCNAPGCRGEVSVEIKTPQPYCTNTGVIMEAKGTGINNAPLYTWTLPDKTVFKGKSLTATLPGIYTIKYQPANDTCSITNSVDLKILQQPFISLGSDTAICKESTYALQPVISSGIDNYLWQDGSSSASYNVSDTGLYYVTASNACGSDADTIRITYKPTATVLLRSDTAVCKYDYAELQNLQHNDFPVNYQWSNGETSKVIRAYDDGVYWLDVYGECIQDKVRDTVVIIRKIDDCECFLLVPNAFTPNGDGLNDRFILSSECSVRGTLQIYNRWGGLVFSTADVLNGWNGKKGGVVQPGGLYVYKIRYEYEGRPGEFTKNGTVQLIH